MRLSFRSSVAVPIHVGNALVASLLRSWVLFLPGYTFHTGSETQKLLVRGERHLDYNRSVCAKVNTLIIPESSCFFYSAEQGGRKREFDAKKGREDGLQSCDIHSKYNT